MVELEMHYRKVLQQVEDAVKAAHRPIGAVQLIAVSKTFPADDIEALYRLGQRDFGENYIQEWWDKTEQLSECSELIWHVIGHVQTNKTKYVAQKAHWLHTLDRFKTAERLSRQRPEYLPSLQVCIEVNVTRRPERHGVLPEEVMDLALEVEKLPKLKLRGLMCVAENTDDAEILESQFELMAALLADLQSAGMAVDTLSMGMSSDMEVAIQHGATQVRVGTAIFGNRDYATS